MFEFLRKSGENEPMLSKKRLWIIVLCGALGAALLLFGGSLGEKKKGSSAGEEASGEEFFAYQTYLEDRVRTLCESVSGVSDVTVIVTLDGEFRRVYATESDGEREEYVILGSGSSASALFLSRDAPQIAGIGVVCRGGGNPSVQKELISLLSAAFHLSSNRVYVTEANR